uniref:glutathione peroxidase n=1 Tax=Erpetoichthys calabaricus TaxID=27687 RepID=A0A8C4T4W3_ERPCA
MYMHKFFKAVLIKSVTYAFLFALPQTLLIALFFHFQSACPPAGDNFGDTKKLFWEPLRINDIKWNFEKFLVGPDGKPVKRWHPRVSVNVVKKEIQQYLKGMAQ